MFSISHLQAQEIATESLVTHQGSDFDCTTPLFSVTYESMIAEFIRKRTLGFTQKGFHSVAPKANSTIYAQRLLDGVPRWNIANGFVAPSNCLVLLAITGDFTPVTM